MPKRVDDVRFSMERVRLGVILLFDLLSRYDGSWFSVDFIGGDGGSVEVGVIWNARCGKGRRIGKPSVIVDTRLIVVVKAVLGSAGQLTLCTIVLRHDYYPTETAQDGRKVARRRISLTRDSGRGVTQSEAVPYVDWVCRSM